MTKVSNVGAVITGESCWTSSTKDDTRIITSLLLNACFLQTTHRQDGSFLFTDQSRQMVPKKCETRTKFLRFCVSALPFWGLWMEQSTVIVTYLTALRKTVRRRLI